MTHAIPAAAAAVSGEASLQVAPETWGVFALLVVVLIVVDLLVFGRGRRGVTVKASATWSVGWLLLALGFGAALWAWQGSQASSEYFAGYLLERSLSLDNIFVFAVIFSYFAVPIALQPRVLAWGIVLALALRVVFILIGASLLATFHATFYVFGAILLFTAWKLYHHDEAGIEPEHNPALRLLRRHVPMTSDYHGHRLTVPAEGGRVATPLLAVLLVVGSTDVVFATDSIPAIFAITQDAFIVCAANAFALLGLRALYFTLVGAMERFVYLSYGLAVILAFIGAKMLLIDLWHPPIWLSLVVIVGVLAITALLSLGATPHRPRAPERAPKLSEQGDPVAASGAPEDREQPAAAREAIAAGHSAR